MNRVTGRPRERWASHPIPATLADPTHTTSGPVGCAARNRSTRSAAPVPIAMSMGLYASILSIVAATESC